jgi:hypothetical protein|nr:MAG TPA: hypothetical protein [Caudoviricetes sp.]
MTKENYQDAIMRMYDFCIASNHPAHIKEQFTKDLDFLAKLANEHFEEKSETNYEHYKDEIIENSGFQFSLVDGKPHQCSDVRCLDCGFSTGHGCTEKVKEWLKSPYKKPTYKLSQFEYDLLNAYKDGGMRKFVSNYRALLELHKKGYFKEIDTSIPIHEILDNCEVI